MKLPAFVRTRGGLGALALCLSLTTMTTMACSPTEPGGSASGGTTGGGGAQTGGGSGGIPGGGSSGTGGARVSGSGGSPAGGGSGGAAATGGSFGTGGDASTGGIGGPATGGASATGGGGGPGTGGASATGGGSATGGNSGGQGGGSASSGGAGGGGAVVSLFDGTTLSGWLPSSGTGVGNAPGTWDVQDAALHCTGMVRGTLISKSDYGNFRLIFWVRQLPSTGIDNHYASVLIWGTRPPPNDAIGGLQFGTPNGYYWDYRPGHNNSGAAFFVSTPGGISRTAWAQCEILANTATGVARMACCSLGTATSCKAKEVLRFTDPTAGRKGPIALQAHSAGGHDEYKNITIEENPPVNDLITTH